MKRKIAILVSGTIFLSAISVDQALASASPTQSTSTSENQTAPTFWVTGVNLDYASLSSLTDNPDLQVIQALSEFDVDGHTLRVGLSDASLNDLNKATEETIDDIIAMTEQYAAAGNLNALQDLGEASYSAAINGLHFDAVELADPAGAMPSSLTVLTSTGVKSSPVSYQGQAKAQKISRQSVCGSWAPNFINAKSDVHSVSGRYVRITFAWTPSELAALRCTGSSTFEPDFVTYNYDGKHYLGSNTLSWASNLPDAYSDTTFMDSQNEPTYTIGTPSNSKLEAGLTYSNYIHTDSGNYGSDLAKIVWQRGRQVFGCPPLPVTWCVFSDESQVILAWLITMPGSY
ncbi:MAG: hypothetical protein ACKOWK_05465 [Micrococcales bacterium]